MIYNEDAIKFMKKQDKGKYNIIYTDVPYNLGSEYVIDDKTGHYKFEGSGKDFMHQWETFDGIWWYEFFKESYRILKPGGFFITHNIDRQSDMWTYYARRSGFKPVQKLYWLFLGSFPKGVDLALKIDEHLGVEREVIGERKGAQAESTGRYGSWGKKEKQMRNQNYMQGMYSVYDKTVATSELAKKYDGYKYGQAALKQVLEEIPVYVKPLENSMAKNIKDFENGKDIHPSIYNIKNTGLPTKNLSLPTKDISSPKWTPQLVVDERIYNSLIKKIGNEKAAKINESIHTLSIKETEPYVYTPKTSTAEREAGLDNFEDRIVNDGRKKDIDNPHQRGKTKRKNTHPSPKPIALCKWILSIFEIPDKDKMLIYDPFAGQGSIPIAAEELGIKWEATEINEEYIEIAKAKLNHYKHKLTLF